MPVSKGKGCFGDVMGEFKRGQLHSGKKGPVVKSRQQAKAIAASMCLSEKEKKKEEIMALGYSEEAAEMLAELSYGGLWENIHKKRERIKRGSGERMRRPGEKGAPSEADLKAASKDDKKK